LGVELSVAGVISDYAADATFEADLGHDLQGLGFIPPLEGSSRFRFLLQGSHSNTILLALMHFN